mmetsp:Transcript_88722/g.253566  ORF Transcript_88722/g.253566 Transcript_88722/m.253566 type:complete len:206 (+) Transcript_88722:440-1057(+)
MLWGPLCRRSDVVSEEVEPEDHPLQPHRQRLDLRAQMWEVTIVNYGTVETVRNAKPRRAEAVVLYVLFRSAEGRLVPEFFVVIQASNVRCKVASSHLAILHGRYLYGSRVYWWVDDVRLVPVKLGIVDVVGHLRHGQAWQLSGASQCERGQDSKEREAGVWLGASPWSQRPQKGTTVRSRGPSRSRVPEWTQHDSKIHVLWRTKR